MGKMGIVFKPEDSKKEKVKKISKELQVSEEEAEKILERRELTEEEK